VAAGIAAGGAEWGQEVVRPAAWARLPQTAEAGNQRGEAGKQTGLEVLPIRA